MGKKAVFAGTFDPPSLGHLDIIRRAAQLCDKLYVVVAKNVNKAEALFSLDERKDLLEKITGSLSNVEVVAFDGLLVSFTKDHQVDFIVRGLRSFSSHEAELQMALANRKLGGIETVFLIGDDSFSHISSSLIREVGAFGQSLCNFVPEEIERKVAKKILEKMGNRRFPSSS